LAINLKGVEAGEFWKIERLKDRIYFQSYQAIVIWEKTSNNWSVLRANQQFGFLFPVNDRLILNDQGSGLAELTDGKLQPIPGGGFFAGKEVWSIIDYRGGFLVTTQNEGSFFFSSGRVEKWNSEVNDFLLQNRFFSLQESDSIFYWGSILNGLIISDKEGNILQHINRKNGLVNNTVLSLFLDMEENLWLGLDNGISQIYVHSSLSELITEEDIGSGYAAAKLGNRIYLGTNQGLYWISDFNQQERREENLPIAIPELAGQVWALRVEGEELLVGHNRGTFAIRGNQVRQISDAHGGWNFVPVPGRKNLYLQGTYTGLQVLEATPGGVVLRNRIEGFSESSRSLFFENDSTVWLGHGYKGVYKLILNQALSAVARVIIFNEKSGLKTKNFNELLMVDREVLVGNPIGIFTFNPRINDFEPGTWWNQQFADKGRMTRLIKEDEETYWFFFQDAGAGKLRIFNDSIFIRDNQILALLSNSFIASYENVCFLDDQQLLFGTDQGFVLLNQGLKMNYSKAFPSLFISLESLRTDSATKVFLGFKETIPPELGSDPPILLPYRDNDLRITFVAPFLTAPEKTEYQYKISGLEEDWNNWSVQRTAEFTNLREGGYTFSIRARNIYGVISEENHLRFQIRTPWYRSLLAYSTYILLLAFAIFGFNFAINRKLDREKRRAKIQEERRMHHKQLQLQRDSELAEKEIVKLRNDKLLADIRHKSKELANRTMGIIQKNKFLTDIKEEMVRLKKQAQNEEIRSSMKRMIRNIDRNIEDEDTQKVFETNFDQVHENFLQRLSETHPELSSRDLRLCAYLRLNLSSKEIAPLLNISVRGVEISRYRLRKRLKLDHQEHLTDYILRF
jgi:ligand-binding sensor domain-containing protein/DNA-binding CsgD family transcriptional regulator